MDFEKLEKKTKKEIIKEFENYIKEEETKNMNIITQEKFDEVVSQNNDSLTKIKELENELLSISDGKEELENKLSSVSNEKEELENKLSSISDKKEELENKLSSISDKKEKKKPKKCVITKN